MKNLFVALAVVALSVVPAQARESDAWVRQHLVKESRMSYPGNCPCPYDTDRAGRSCGRRSAYSRPGGYAPLCYVSDVSAADVAAYRARH